MKETQTTGRSECSVEGCTDPGGAKGMCKKHYMRMKKGWEDLNIGKHGPLKGRVCRICGDRFDAEDGRQTVCNKHKVCSVKGCNKKAKARGLCPKHYSQRWRARRKL